MKFKRRNTKKIWVGNVPIGGDAQISIQSMTKVPTYNIKKTVRQIKELEEVGCQIVRVAIPGLSSAEAISSIKKEIKIPLVADIHFNYRLALKSMEQGVDKIRLNPGNICRPEEIEAVVKEAKRRKIPIRIGVNSGSVSSGRIHPACSGRVDSAPSSSKLDHYSSGRVYPASLPQKMVDAALRYIRLFEKLKFKDIVISLKTPDIFSTIESYRLMAKEVDYPFHLGMTATGPLIPALIKSSLGIGILLKEGMGDTLRVSLTGNPIDEVKAGYEILKTLGLKNGIEIISCPTCGRCKVNLVKIVHDFEKSLSRSGAIHPTCNGAIYPVIARNEVTKQSICSGAIYRTCSGRVYSARNGRLCVANLKLPLKVAIMGCEVNGPGEAKDADIGIAFGGRKALLFKEGKPIKKVPEDKAVSVLLNEVKKKFFKKLLAKFQK